MINKNELRIGNYVFYGKTTARRISMIVHDGRVGVDSLIVKNETISPIALTPEILEKAGFERGKRKDWSNDIFYVWYKDGIDIHEGNEPTEFLYATHVKGAESSFKAGIQVNTVHHLQNLFHALTSKELEIKDL